MNFTFWIDWDEGNFFFSDEDIAKEHPISFEDFLLKNCSSIEEFIELSEERRTSLLQKFVAKKKERVRFLKAELDEITIVINGEEITCLSNGIEVFRGKGDVNKNVHLD